MAFGEDLPELDADMIASAMDRASRLGATYADVRVEAVEREGAEAENGIIKTLAATFAAYESAAKNRVVYL